MAIKIYAPQKEILVIWNVEQGSWTSYISDLYCIHIDAGGARIPLSTLCKNKKNILLFTHYDWDHIGLANHIYTSEPKTCLWQTLPKTLQHAKRKFLEKIPQCAKMKIPQLQTIYTSAFKWINESHAFVLAGQLLITGDSDQKTEKKWIYKNDLKSIRLLLAGHHGSRTSLARELLTRTPELKMVFASCKKKRYGHPHRQTIEKIKKRKLPLLITTEAFGSMAIEMDSNDQTWSGL